MKKARGLCHLPYSLTTSPSSPQSTDTSSSTPSAPPRRSRSSPGSNRGVLLPLLPDNPSVRRAPIRGASGVAIRFLCLWGFHNGPIRLRSRFLQSEHCSHGRGRRPSRPDVWSGSGRHGGRRNDSRCHQIHVGGARSPRPAR